MKKVFENLQYITLGLLIAGQILIGDYYLIGQFIYLAANAISVSRCFVLDRPMSDKAKDFACLGLTFGLILLRIFQNNA